ncbi:hypothetical protein Lesp02_05700 [Lentzea sp. NBRC 105346]|uniref:DUF3103 family protein n=1 Tax=Lentzea sp. NBRC 105346 TaxID=3032205 RepID=UPI00249FB526|nr:DUF3103 family protein [Lentzea sp. NBRC 105346]GLZ28380.1 hypothetical protein Lesp02_05700 [Lentzea sp. NBRC 105346]
MRTFVVVVLTLATLSPTATAAPTGPVHRITDQIARDLAAGLADTTTRARITNAVLTSPTHLADLGLAGPLATKIVTAERRLATAKGLPESKLLTIRLGHEKMADQLRAGALPKIAAAPDDDRAVTFTAYGTDGRKQLPTAQVSDEPVLLVDVDVERAVTLGMNVLRQVLPAPAVSATAAGYWATKIARVRVSDVQEPWFKGDAEIFSLVTGFGLDGKVRVDTVTMPYLDEENTTYYPNQLLVHWNAYKYDLADVVMMEDDGDTNYRALAQAIATALLTIVDGGAYIPLVDAILGAIPDSWYTDDPDYVESWYTLAEQGSGVLNGASARGWIDTVPYFVREF